MSTAADFRLIDLLPQAPDRIAALHVSGICIDSRRVAPGDLFFARRGVNHRGVDFIPAAIAGGAVAVVVDSSELDEAQAAGFSVPVIRIERLEREIGRVASRFHGEPSHQMQVLGVTGTNGKTSCAHYLAQALNACGVRTALIGTVGNGFPGQLRTATHTTPDALALQAELARLRAEGAEAVVMEVSSHALDQHRVAGVQFVAAAYSNLTHDHLDYHGDMASYAAAKARLFTEYGVPLQVLNADDAEGARLLSEACPAGVERIGFSLQSQGAAVFASELQMRPLGLMFQLHTPWGEVLVTAPLLGRFNASNLLLVAAVLGGLGHELSSIADVLARLVPVCGRMEQLAQPGAPLVIVDYAHTPDALEQALQAARAHTQASGRLWAVFGCGGDRDTAKRPVMGNIAARLADEIVLTSDNPRSENPHRIIEMIAQGIEPSLKPQIEPDRAQAIAQVIAQAAPIDTILVAGKGHETYQEIQGVRHPFSDQQQVRAALAKRGAA